jgi:ParB-like chromosome segregation protein Spo0J
MDVRPSRTPAERRWQRALLRATIASAPALVAGASDLEVRVMALARTTAPMPAISRVVDAGRGFAAFAAERLHRTRPLAPSLYDVLPQADSIQRRPVRFETVPSGRIVGTVRHPSTIEVDFRPIEPLRTRAWEFRTARIQDAIDSLIDLPPVTVFEVAGDYYVVDGHHRVAAAKRLGADVDALVTTLVVPPPMAMARGIRSGVC